MWTLVPVLAFPQCSLGRTCPAAGWGGSGSETAAFAEDALWTQRSRRTPRPFGLAEKLPHLAEREHICLGAGLEERDLQRPLADSVVLTHELVEAAVPEQAVPGPVDVDAL